LSGYLLSLHVSLPTGKPPRGTTSSNTAVPQHWVSFPLIRTGGVDLKKSSKLRLYSNSSASSADVPHTSRSAGGPRMTRGTSIWAVLEDERIPGPSGVIRGFHEGQAPHRPIVHPSSCGRFEVRTTARPLHHQGPRRRLRPDYSLVGVGRVLLSIPRTCFSTRDCEVQGETESSHAPYRLFDSQSGLTESRRSRFPRVTSSLPKPAWRRTISSMLTVFPSQSGVPDRVPTFA
jgi:hypothetical protein